ncbi:putative disks large-like protein [Cricetulus griseus]|nr:putative disks large-like protein [Cricetulus griseus]
MVDYIHRFSNVEPNLHTGDEAYLIMIDDFSDILLDLGCQYFTEYFCIYVHEGYWSVILFLRCVFVWVVYQVRLYKEKVPCDAEKKVYSFVFGWNVL